VLKRTYLAILSVAIVSVLLGSLFYSNVTFAPKPTEPTQVEVINFPLDEQGNLKVSSGVTSKVVTVVKDLNLSWTVTQRDYEDLMVDVDGYNEFVVYASFRNWTTYCGFAVVVRFVTDEIGVYTSPEDPYIQGNTEDDTPYTEPLNASALYHIRSPFVVIRVSAQRMHEYQADGWILASISLYLRN